MPVPMIAPSPSAVRSPSADDALEAGALLLGLAHEHVGGLGRERPATLFGGCGRHVRLSYGVGGGVITSTGRRERSISRVVTVPSMRRATRPAGGRADDDQVGLLLLGEHEHAADDRPGAMLRVHA